jgi:hypothetical protein
MLTCGQAGIRKTQTYEVGSTSLGKYRSENMLHWICVLMKVRSVL